MAVSNDYDIANLALAVYGQPEISSLSAGGRDADVCNLYYAQNRDWVLELADWKCAMKRASLGDDTSEATITGITQADPGVVTAAAHGWANGDVVLITDVSGMTEVNDEYFTIANVTTNTFELSGVDTSGYTAYSSGGTADRNQTGYSYMYDLPSDCLRVREVLDSDWGADDSYDYRVEGTYLYTDVQDARVRYIKQETDVTKYDSALVEVMAARLAWLICVVVTGDQQRRAMMKAEYQAVLAKATAVNAWEAKKDDPPDTWHTDLR